MDLYISKESLTDNEFFNYTDPYSNGLKCQNNNNHPDPYENPNYLRSFNEFDIPNKFRLRESEKIYIQNFNELNNKYHKIDNCKLNQKF